MASIITRPLGGNDNKDVRCVRVDSQTYKDKWGVIELVLNSYTTSGTGTLAGNVDVRPPNYNPASDEVYLNNVAIAGAPGTVSSTKKFYFAVNNGVPGPAVRVNPDGTWDLMEMVFNQKPDNAQVDTRVSLSFTLSAFVDLTATVNPAGSAPDLVLSVNKDKPHDEATIGVTAASIAGLNGRVLTSLNFVYTENIDQPIKTPFNTAPLSPVGESGDSTHLFECVNAKLPSNNFTSQGVIASHLLPKVSGSKIYYQAHMIFAVNNGKIDGNGRNINTSSGGQIHLLRCSLHGSGYSDDTATVTVGYTTTFTSMP
jgi:hypothetical protein